MCLEGLPKAYNWLDSSSGRGYLARNVVFDEQVFPFAKLHSNASAQLRKELVLLPPHLLPPNFLQGADTAVGPMSISNNLDNSAESVQATGQEIN